MFDNNFKSGCFGCAFAGKNFVCTTSTGQCLKTKPQVDEDKKQNIEKSEKDRRKKKAAFSR